MRAEWIYLHSIPDSLRNRIVADLDLRLGELKGKAKVRIEDQLRVIRNSVLKFQGLNSAPKE